MQPGCTAMTNRIQVGEMLLHDGVEAYKKEGSKFMQRLHEGCTGGARDAPFCEASVFNDNSRHFCINESKRHHWPLPHI